MVGFVLLFINTKAPGTDRADYFGFHNLSANQAAFMIGDEFVKLSHPPIIRDGEVYLPVSFVEQYIDRWIFWDEVTRRLTITDENFVIQMDAGENTYYVNGRPETIEQPIYYNNGTAFIPQSLLWNRYHVYVNHAEVENGTLVWVDFASAALNNLRPTVHTIVDTPLRLEPHRWSPVIVDLPLDTTLTHYSLGEDIESGLTSRELGRLEILVNRRINDSFARVRTNNGLVGYILRDELNENEAVYTTMQSLPQWHPIPEFTPQRAIDGKIVMVWDMMESESQNTPWTKNDHHALDVISPQWFRFERETYSGEVLSIASHQYMSWAHERGLHIWPKVFDSEDGNVTGLILADQQKREFVIAQLLDLIDTYNLDGLNIDFERVREVDVRYFHQFLRELWPPMRERGAVLSAAVFVPAAWSLYYDRGAIAEAVDFVAVMTYDEYTINSSEPGPNASIGFVETAVTNMLFNHPPNQVGVPPEKLLLGIPFYSRVWIETLDDNGIAEDFRVRSLGMNFARRMFTDNGVVFEWQEDVGKYYGEFEIFEDGRMRRYRTWLEDARSMAEKIDIVHRYHLAGVAAWVWGLENEATWELLYDELKN